MNTIESLYNQPLLRLVSKAHDVHQKHHTIDEVQVCSLISIKTGGCPENCAYCPQSSHYTTGITPSPLMKVEEVLKQAKQAIENGASRICLGAAWREVREGKAFDQILEMIKEIRALNVEVCCTLGMLQENQALKLKKAGLVAYNHNLDSSSSFYSKIISTRTYEDRLETLKKIGSVGIQICCGGILGMGESIQDRLALLHTLKNLPIPPTSIPLNLLEAIPGTPLEKNPPVPFWELLRLIATTRIVFPEAMVRLSCGRKKLSFQEQALSFFAGANSIHAGDKLLTQPNSSPDQDEEMFSLLGIRKKQGNYRTLQAKASSFIDFASNDYLSIGWGSTGSRLLAGDSEKAHQLETKIASFHGFSSALLFGCGFMANLGLVSTLQGTILYDAEIHASMKEGLKLSKARSFPFRHHDLKHLEKRLEKASGSTWILVESVYSTDGSLAPLKEICALAHRYQAKLIVDEAHAVGIFGKQGEGRIGELNLQPHVFAIVVTFGKAFSAYGAAICGPFFLRERLINFASSFIYTTALPPVLLDVIDRHYDQIHAMEKERAHLHHLMSLFPDPSPIQIFSIPGNDSAKEKARALKQLGFDVRPLLSPTVQKGKERLRICLHAHNTEEEVKALQKALQ